MLFSLEMKQIHDERCFLVFEGCRCAQVRSILVTVRSFKHVLHVTILGACEWWHKSHGRYAGNQNGFVEKFWCWSMKSDNMELTPEYGTSGGGDSFGWTDKFVGFMGATWGIPFSMLEGIWCKPSLFIEDVSPIEDVSLIDLWSKLRFQLPCYQGVYLLEARINHCRFGDQDLRTDTASDSQRQRCHGLLSEFDVSKRVRPETMNIHEYPSCTSTFLYYVIW